MTTMEVSVGHQPLVLHTRPVFDMSDELFFDFCQTNREWRIERNAEGEILVMPPAGGETSSRNALLTTILTTWASQDGTGVAFDSSAGFDLPNGATRSPDAAWIRTSRLTPLTPEQKKRFLPLCPDFVIELRSPSDHLRTLQDKMQEYIDNGTGLGWLLDTPNRRVYIFRPGKAVECLENPPSVAGEPELPGFVSTLHGSGNLAFKSVQHAGRPAHRSHYEKRLSAYTKSAATVLLLQNRPAACPTKSRRLLVAQPARLCGAESLLSFRIGVITSVSR